jgi:hypothetical protein
VVGIDGDYFAVGVDELFLIMASVGILDMFIPFADIGGGIAVLCFFDGLSVW